MFYPHYFNVTQQDNNDTTITTTAPAGLKTDIKKLIEIRKIYLGGGLTVLSEVGNPYPSGDTYTVYVARRQGNGTKSGGVIVLNNDDSNTRGLWVDVSPTGFDNWAGQTLVNAVNGTDTVYVYPDGRAYFSAPSRGYSVWVKKSEYQALSAFSSAPATAGLIDAGGKEGIAAYPNPASHMVNINVALNNAARVNLSVVNTAGATVGVLYRGNLSSGKSNFTWNCNGQPSGNYFCVLHTGKQVFKKQIIVVR